MCNRLNQTFVSSNACAQLTKTTISHLPSVDNFHECTNPQRAQVHLRILEHFRACQFPVDSIALPSLDKFKYALHSSCFIAVRIHKSATDAVIPSQPFRVNRDVCTFSSFCVGRKQRLTPPIRGLAFDLHVFSADANCETTLLRTLLVMFGTRHTRPVDPPGSSLKTSLPVACRNSRSALQL